MPHLPSPPRAPAPGRRAGSPSPGAGRTRRTSPRGRASRGRRCRPRWRPRRAPGSAGWPSSAFSTSTRRMRHGSAPLAASRTLASRSPSRVIAAAAVIRANAALVVFSFLKPKPSGGATAGTSDRGHQVAAAEPVERLGGEEVEGVVGALLVAPDDDAALQHQQRQRQIGPGEQPRDVASHRRDVAHLVGRDARRHPVEHPAVGAVADQVGQGRGGADAEAAVCLARCRAARAA